jgi:hypothetical protein
MGKLFTRMADAARNDAALAEAADLNNVAAAAAARAVEFDHSAKQCMYGLTMPRYTNTMQSEAEAIQLSPTEQQYGQHISKLQGVSAFGEAALLQTSNVRNASVICKTPCILLALHRVYYSKCAAAAAKNGSASAADAAPSAQAIANLIQGKNAIYYYIVRSFVLSLSFSAQAIANLIQGKKCDVSLSTFLSTFFISLERMILTFDSMNSFCFAQGTPCFAS